MRSVGAPWTTELDGEMVSCFAGYVDSGSIGV